MSSSIEKCYTKLELIIKNILTQVDGNIPNSSDWHKSLIDRASITGPTGRPPLFNTEIIYTLHDLRGFRHRERNAYVTHLGDAIVLEKAATICDLVDKIGEFFVKNGMPEYRENILKKRQRGRGDCGM